MRLNKLYFDNHEFNTFCQLAIKENLITEYHNGFFDKSDLVSDQLPPPERTHKKAQILLYIMLYDQIETWSTKYNLEYFCKNGLIDRFAYEQNNFGNTMGGYLPLGYKSFDSMYSTFSKGNEEVIKLATSTSTKILKYNRVKFLNLVRKNYPKEYGLYSKMDPIPSSSLAMKMANWLIDNSNQMSNINDMPHSEYGYFSKFLIDCYKQEFHSLKYGIIKSSIEGVSFQSKYNLNKGQSVQPEIKENVQYIVRTKLEDELLIFPRPRNIQEALELKMDKNIIRFKEVLNQWLLTLENGEHKLEKKMRKDLRVANRDIRNVKKWVEYKKSPVGFVISLVGGHIPGFSSILSILDSIGSFYEIRTEKLHNWVSIMKQ